jgi:glycine cleavage system H protein
MSRLQHPDNLRYAETHEWVRVEGDQATIGISDFAQDSLGEVVFLLYQVKAGQQIKQNSKFGEVESVKATSELFSPVSGEVVRINPAFAEESQDPDAYQVIKDDPYNGGWMLVVKMSDPSEVEKLMTAEQYEEFLKNQ